MVRHGQRLPVFVPAFGLHMVYNALAAIAVAEHNGISGEKAAAALQQYRPLACASRGMEANGITVIDDTYNASPDSMMGSVDVLASIKVSGRRIAVLADMLELGDVSAEAHRSVGRRCAQRKVDFLYVIGRKPKRLPQGQKSLCLTWTAGSLWTMLRRWQI